MHGNRLQKTAQACRIAEFAQNLTRWTICALLQILAATRDATQIKKGAQWCNLTRYMSAAHTTTLRAAGVLMNIDLRKRDLIFHVLISQEPEFWHL